MATPDDLAEFNYSQQAFMATRSPWSDLSRGAMRSNPKVLLLDEPLEGLAPTVADGILEGIRRLRREDEMTILVVEQHIRVALELAPRSIVLDRGRITFDGASTDLLKDEDRLNALMGGASRQH
jgi:branched-chain amino acid transport system ATP-binding protein